MGASSILSKKISATTAAKEGKGGQCAKDAAPGVEEDVCDTATQGCNSNGHGEWARNIEDQFQHMNILQGFGWVHCRPKRLKGIGNVRVKTIGHMRLPAALWSVNSTKILLGFLESHEQCGNHPLFFV